MRTLISFALSYYFSIACFSQTQQFKIVNRDTKKAVPFATIKFTTKSGGVFASDSGTFSLEIKNKDSLIVSSVGYEAKRIAGSQIRSLIELTPKAISLAPLIIKASDN